MSAFPFMPPWLPFDVLRTVDLFASATSLAQTITMPAGVRAGDLAILVDALAGGNSAVVIPTGFTGLYSILTSGGWGRNHRVSYRVIQSSAEAGSVITGGVGDVNTRKILLVFRGNVPIKTATYVAGVSTGTNGDPGGLNHTPAADAAPLILWAVLSTTSHATTPFQTYGPATNPAFDGEIYVDSLRVGYRTNDLGETPATQYIDMADLGASNAMTMAHLTLEG